MIKFVVLLTCPQCFQFLAGSLFLDDVILSVSGGNPRKFRVEQSTHEVGPFLQIADIKVEPRFLVQVKSLFFVATKILSKFLLLPGRQVQCLEVPRPYYSGIPATKIFVEAALRGTGKRHVLAQTNPRPTMRHY